MVAAAGDQEHLARHVDSTARLQLINIDVDIEQQQCGAYDESPEAPGGIDTATRLLEAQTWLGLTRPWG